MRIFQSRDLILRDTAAVRHPSLKLGPNLEGSYKVICSLGKGGYNLKDLKGKQPNMLWNAEHLQKYHQ